MKSFIKKFKKKLSIRCRKFNQLALGSLLAFFIWYTLGISYISDSKTSVNSLINKETNIINRKEKINYSNLLNPKKFNINCKRLIEFDKAEIEQSKKIIYSTKTSFRIPDIRYTFVRNSCNDFKQSRGYNAHKVVESEYEFPIAYSILTYKNVEQFERLLRTIYRPHNLYCIHIDAKSSFIFYQAIKSIAKCFSNVFIASKLENIIYAGYSRLQADLNCMNDLLASNFSYEFNNKTFKWKYLINLASTEFPLRTNYELTQILRLYNGSNDIEVMHKFHRSRVQFKWNIVNKKGKYILARTNIKKTQVPYNYTIVKGITYCAFTRDFVYYVLHNRYAKALLEWSQDTFSPDEWYWATINYNTQFMPPGGFHSSKMDLIPTLTRYIRWSRKTSKCYGFVRNNICILTVEDLSTLVNRNEFFANKFLLDLDPITYQCLEEWIDNREQNVEAIQQENYCHLPFLKLKRCTS